MAIDDPSDGEPPDKSRPAPSDWIIKDIQVGHRCGFCGKDFDVNAGHTCAEAAISPGGKTFLTTVEDAPIPRCPTCSSTTTALRFRLNADDPASDCANAWHDQPHPDPERHAPRIARTLMEGPGNRTMIRGCACGAAVMSDEAYAQHVGWPVEAVRALLGLYGIADDLHRFPVEGDWKLRGRTREDLWKKIDHHLEVRSTPPVPAPHDYATSGPYEIKGGEVVGPNLRVILDHVIELLHMRHVDDPRGLPTVSMMGAIGELVALLNGAYDQGRRGVTRKDQP